MVLFVRENPIHPDCSSVSEFKLKPGASSLPQRMEPLRIPRVALAAFLKSFNKLGALSRLPIIRVAVNKIDGTSCALSLGL